MPTIVVGIDGSPTSVKALRWAVDEARIRRAVVRVVHAWQFRYHDGEIAHLAAESAQGALEQLAERTLEAALDNIADLSGTVIERSLVEASPAQALIAAAQDADLLVVGSRGRGGFAALLLGSVSYQCATHAPCPIVIVRAD